MWDGIIDNEEWFLMYCVNCQLPKNMEIEGKLGEYSLIYKPNKNTKNTHYTTSSYMDMAKYCMAIFNNRDKL